MEFDFSDFSFFSLFYFFFNIFFSGENFRFLTHKIIFTRFDYDISCLSGILLKLKTIINWWKCLKMEELKMLLKKSQDNFHGSILRKKWKFTKGSLKKSWKFCCLYIFYLLYSERERERERQRENERKFVVFTLSQHNHHHYAA